MIKKYNNISLAWGVPGLVIQTAGILCDQPLVMWLGSLLFLVGLAYYAKAKRQHPAWCLMRSTRLSSIASGLKRTLTTEWRLGPSSYLM